VNPSLSIEPCAAVDHGAWFELRDALWPHASREEHAAEMQAFLAEPQRYAQFVARLGGEPVGLVEVSIRNDYVNGTERSPVGFLEGLFVMAAQRRQGIARQLIAAAQAWVRAQGCSEMASDAGLDNPTSHAVHRALGFEETERVVYFRRAL
jgi:aminoglycoside 6'-N-acetyltransferase I